MKSSLPLCAIFFLACSTVASDKLATDQIGARFKVDVYSAVPGLTTNEPAGTRVEATFRDGLSDVTLASGDTLSGKTDKVASLSFKQEDFLGMPAYVARFPALDSTTVTVSLARATGTGAPLSTTSIPAALVLNTPLPKTIAYGDTLKVEWSNKVSGAKLEYRTFPCGGVGTTEFDDKKVDDEGSREFTGAMLAGKTAPTSPQCLKLDMARSTDSGTVDPAFKSGGSFTATRHDIYEITVTP